MFRIILIICFCILISRMSYGQADYYISDTTKAIGIKLVDGGIVQNCMFCQVKNGALIRKFTPTEVKEYQFRNGRTYISRAIPFGDSSRKVFMERLYEGKLSLYYYKSRGMKRFFLSRDSITLTEIMRRDASGRSYHEQLSEQTGDCENLRESCSNTPYAPLSLTRLMQQYEHCKPRYFPHFRTGISLGYETQLLQTDHLDDDLFTYIQGASDSWPIYGIFLDAPFGATDMSFHLEAQYSTHQYTLTSTLATGDFDFFARMNSFSVPFLLRYTYPFRTVRPFVNAGPFLLLNTKHEFRYYYADKQENTIVITRNSLPFFINDAYAGICLGAGFEIRLSGKYSLAIEARSKRVFTSTLATTCGFKSMDIVTSIAF